MDIEAAVAHFTNRAGIARALGDARSVSAVYQWKDAVPLAAARRLEALTEGKLKVDPSLYDEHGQVIHNSQKASA